MRGFAVFFDRSFGGVYRRRADADRRAHELGELGAEVHGVYDIAPDSLMPERLKIAVPTCAWADACYAVELGRYGKR